MSRMKEFPRYNIVSIRVTDEEMNALAQLKVEQNRSFSRIIREALSAMNPANQVGKVFSESQ